MFGLTCALSGCASPPRDQAFNKVANAGIHRIALLKVPEADLRVINIGGALGGFGLIGAALAESDEDSKSQAFAVSVGGRARLGELLTQTLATELEKSGYEVTVEAQRPVTDAGPDTAKVNEKADYSNVKTDADAIMDVSFLGAGYLSPAGSSVYMPWLHLRARLVSPGGRAQLFFQFMVYGAKFPQTKEYFASRPQYSYGDFDSLMKDPNAAAEGLTAGLGPIATRIAQQLR